MAAITTQEFEHHFKSLYKPLCLFALRYTDQVDDAEDIVQQAFADVWDKNRAGSRFNPVCTMCDGGRGCLLIVRFMELVRVHMGDGKVRVYFSIPFPVII